MEYTESHVARLLNTDWRPKMSFLRSCNVQKLDVPRGMGSLQLVIYLTCYNIATLQSKGHTGARQTRSSHHLK